MNDEIEPDPITEVRPSQGNTAPDPEKESPPESSEDELRRAYYLQQHCRPHALL
jgi:hypothetical protein